MVEEKPWQQPFCFKDGDIGKGRRYQVSTYDFVTDGDTIAVPLEKLQAPH